MSFEWGNRIILRNILLKIKSGYGRKIKPGNNRICCPALRNSLPSSEKVSAKGLDFLPIRHQATAYWRHAVLEFPSGTDAPPDAMSG